SKRSGTRDHRSVAMTEHDRRIAAMFDRIAPRYDRLNRILSFGTDVGWRRRAAAIARLGPTEVAVDIGAGTGDLARELLRVSDPTSSVIGVDVSAEMLGASARRLPPPRYRAVIANARSLPLRDASVDRIVSAFTLRNV